MPDYKKYKCPVCGKPFEDSDDIVTCPKCATPHHRQCFDLTGHCVNKGLHSAGYDFFADKKSAVSDSDDSKSEGGAKPEFRYYAPPVQPNYNEENSGAQRKAVFSISIEDPYATDKQTIDGNSIADVAATVRTNIPRFVSKFKEMEQKKKKTGWNWGAFFFGSFYFLFRKMYKQGITLLCAAIAVMTACSTAIYKFAPKYFSAIQDIYNSASSAADYTSAESALQNVPDFNKATLICYITIGVFLLMRILEAVFADNAYKKTVCSIIKNTLERLDDDMDSFDMHFTGERNMKKTQFKKMMLERRGGISIFAPLTAYFLIYLIFGMI